MSDHPIVSLKTYFAVIVALFALTALTVWAAFQDFGAMNNLVAMGIAAVKALLVVSIFMHLKYSARIVWMYAGAGVVFFAIMIAFILGDYHGRPMQDRPVAWETPPAAVQASAHAAPAH